MRQKCYAPHRIVMAFQGASHTKTIKPIINEAFVASSEDIITDYNDLYCLFTRCVASRRVNITMSAFVIGETQTTSTTLHRSKLAFESSVAEMYLQWSEAPDCPCDVGISPLYRNSLCASQHCSFQVQEIVLRKLCCTHSNICIVLLWNNVVNTT